MTKIAHFFALTIKVLKGMVVFVEITAVLRFCTVVIIRLNWSKSHVRETALSQTTTTVSIKGVLV